MYIYINILYIYKLLGTALISIVSYAFAFINQLI